MKFIDENSLNRLNFKELLSRIDMYSGYGKSKLNNLYNWIEFYWYRYDKNYFL